MGARDPPGRSRAKAHRCQRARRGSRTPGPAHILETPDTWRPARRLKPEALRSCRRSGLRTGPGLSELSALTQVRRAGLLPIRFQPFRRPRHSAGRSDQTGAVPNTRGPPNWPQASRARGLRDPGRGRRSRPTLTTPRESVPRRTGCAHVGPSSAACQGLFSESPDDRFAGSCERCPISSRVLPPARRARAEAAAV